MTKDVIITAPTTAGQMVQSVSLGDIFSIGGDVEDVVVPAPTTTGEMVQIVQVKNTVHGLFTTHGVKSVIVATPTAAGQVVKNIIVTAPLRIRLGSNC